MTSTIALGWSPWPKRTTADVTDPSYLGSPVGISAYAHEQTDAAHAFLLQLGNLAANLAPPTIEPEFPAGPAVPPQLTATPPTLMPIVWTSPDAPAAFTETLTVEDLMPAPFDEDPPALIFASAPASFTELAPDAPGVAVVYEDPGLTLDLPSVPSLLSLNVTSFSGLDLPTIDPDAIPELTLVAPSIREYVPGAQYTSSLLTGLRGYLEDQITNGGTGLNPDVENAIWDRGREREARSRSDALKDLDKMEEQGFSLPSGVYFDARLKITTESDFVNRGLSREVMIKQAELSLDSIKNALQVSTTLEGQAMNYSNAVEQRLFESTKYATEAGIAIYNAGVQAYAAFLDAYKTKVQIYEAQVRAQIARVEAYKAEIEAETAKAQINTALVEQYKTQVAAAMSAVEIYKARLDGIRYKAAYQGEAAKATAISAFNSSLSDEFKAEVSAVTSFNEVLEREWEAAVKQAQSTAEIGVSTAKANAELYVTVRSLGLDAAKAGAQVSAQLGAAALNAINWSTSISTSNSTGYSESYSGSQSLGYSESLNTNYNYSASV
jgi:hypothetical protein